MSNALKHLSIIFLVLAGLIFLDSYHWLNGPLDFGRQTTRVFSFPSTAILSGTKNFLIGLFSVRNIYRQNNILTRQVEDLTGEVATLEKARTENDTLRAALGFRAAEKLTLRPAEVIGRDLISSSDKVVLGRGSADGLAPGDAVVVAGRIIVGVITTVSAATSEMELVTSSNVVVSAETTTGTASGVVRGEHGLGLLFDSVSQSDIMKSGDRVVTSGLGGKFPKGLLIGQIGEIRANPAELFQKASITPAANLRNIRIVFIVKK